MSSANGYPYALKIYAGRDERKKSEPLGMMLGAWLWNSATAQGIAQRWFHCPVTSGFQKR
ncbi:hypothetical protein T06_11448, partial [Trichinella sp. T6]